MDRAMNKIVIVSQKTRLQELIERFNTKEQAQFYIEHLGASFADYTEEDRKYTEALSLVKHAAEANARVSVIDKSFLHTYIFGAEDIVICVGRDGLVCNTMKYLSDGNPVIGVNPDPGRWDGVVLPFAAEDMKDFLPQLCKSREKMPSKKITFARAATRNGQEIYAANDIFVGPSSHISARYELEYRGKTERQSSSGVIISTGLGQSGWFKSIIAQFNGCARFLQTGERSYKAIGWSDRELSFAVREPFASVNSGADIVMGKITRNEALKMRSIMPEKGVIFSDGIEDDYIEFNSGTEVTITVAEKQGNLIVK
ncbi:MAG: sugar kinase [Lachnospiraceae bacterium]|nr:sugar kinase [Lachnospiraceae bacterium]